MSKNVRLPRPEERDKFCGYEWINHDFFELASIMTEERNMWESALSAVKGVYLVRNTLIGVAYVGATYGQASIWSRLRCYLTTGHGWNDKIVKNIQKLRDCEKYNPQDYKFAVLETLPFDVLGDMVLARESHWQAVMNTK
jgi:hypothetical protein